MPRCSPTSMPWQPVKAWLLHSLSTAICEDESLKGSIFTSQVPWTQVMIETLPTPSSTAYAYTASTGLAAGFILKSIMRPGCTPARRGRALPAQ